MRVPRDDAVWNRIRAFLIRPIPVALFGAVLAYIWITQGTYAREMARFTVCKNRFWQHSGYHGGPTVQLDRNWRVLGVGSCPLCDDHETPMTFVIVDGGAMNYLPDESVIPAETIRDAEVKLAVIRQAPEYQERWQQFKEHRQQLKDYQRKASRADAE